MLSTTLLDDVAAARAPRGYGGLFYGVYPALVTDVVDPDGQGRVRVRLPWSPDPDGQAYEAWARLATLMAGNDRGSWFIPDPGDEVLVAFEAGEPRRPYVVGALWNGKDAPPQSMDGAGRNEKKVLRSRSGVKVTLDDANGREKLILETPGGQTVILEDGPDRIEISDANGSSIELAADGITVVTGAKVTVQASEVEVTAGQVKVTAGMSTFSGIVQARAVITDSVISKSYTPGAGNMW
jgi:uncharacterized protein involved in type VI secretion and phage assembly